MFRKLFVIGLVCIMSLSIMALTASAQVEILGPWLWMIAPTEGGQGGQASTDIDSLAAASNNKVTEEDVAKKGAVEGDAVGEQEWTVGTLAGGGDINALVVSLGFTNNADHNDVTSYAVTTIRAPKAQPNVTMRTGSDDSIKVWVNGEEVFKNATNRGRSKYQDNFKVDLKRGPNLIMVKVSERTGGWGMHVGIEAEFTISTVPGQLSVEPVLKLTTRWAQIKSIR